MRSPHPASIPRVARVDIYGVYHQLKLLESSIADGGAAVSLQGKVTRVEIQNVMGFTKTSRPNWFESWRRLPTSQRPIGRCLQETHVDSVELAQGYKTPGSAGGVNLSMS